MSTPDLRPTWTPPGCVYALQVESMCELHQHASEGLPGRHMLGERLVALAMGPSLSRGDMARAAEMTEAQVAELIAERIAHHAYCDSRAAEQRVARHLPA